MAGTSRSSSSKSMSSAKPARLFAALGDPLRLRLVTRLGDGGPLSITELTSGSRVSRQAVTKHLRVLEGAGLARSRRHGRERRWELDGDELAAAQAQLEKVAAQWDRRLARLKALVETD